LTYVQIIAKINLFINKTKKKVKKMTDFLDAVLLARLQFAFTISFHIIFPAFTIGLASWLAVVEFLWLKTNNKIYEEIYKMWIKIFAVCFGMGVVSGVVMSYQFGTNWSLFSDKVGNVIGPLLGYEVLTAFFLEASFLGIMLFGFKKVSRKMHFFATCVVAVGTLISAFWILSANSWMQTPQGFTITESGLLYPTDWMEIIFNPSFPYRFFHMLTAAYLTTAFVVGGVSAYYLWNKIHIQHAKIMFAMAMLMAIFVTPFQVMIGHAHGENTLKYQPIKIAAMEGNWERGSHKPLYLFGIPNQETESTDFGITIPNGASIIVTGSENGIIPGLKEVAKEDRPPVAIVFWSFRIMVGIGVAMLITGIVATILFIRKTIFSNKIFQLWCMALTPSGFIAVLAGWIVTEVGRQPYTVYGVLKTSHSISPVIAEQVAISLLIFVISYIFIFGAGSYYILKLIAKGPINLNNNKEYYGYGLESRVTEYLMNIKKGDN
jgi:cytochrome bd ubiquinol oxidase subunit I